MSLSEIDIKHRLTALRNLEPLYAKARERITLLEKQNKQLKQKVKELEDRDKDKGEKLEALSFELEQIKNKLFGKKPGVNLLIQKGEKKSRDTFSYQRSIPTKVTETISHPIAVCVHCNGVLKNKSIKVFFEEDIPLPIQKTVVRREVEVGYCTLCKIQSNGYHIPSKKTVLGEHVKKYVCILSIANRMSHTQIQNHLHDVFDFKLSIGEIGNIMETEANNLRPEYQRLKQSIMKQEAVHYDETSWKVQCEEQGKFAWVTTGTENNDTIFSLGRSRGKGNILDLGIASVGISDDYGAYRNSFEEHQLCFAHPQRKFRDLAESSLITEEGRKQCIDTYLQFSKLYKSIRQSLGDKLSSYVKRKFRNDFDILSRHHTLDPTPLSKLKTTLQKNKEKYFTFFKHPHIPIDNNKAERSLRHLVIKRKTSFGSKTQRGAETTSILASIILSLKWNDPEHWFEKYLQLKA